MADQIAPLPPMETIPKLIWGVYSPMAFLAGCQLDVFSQFKDGPLSAEQVAEALGVGVIKLRQLLFALVSTGLLTHSGGRFSNSPEANAYLVKGKLNYMGSRHELMSIGWDALLKTANSIRTGTAQAKAAFDYSSTPSENLEKVFRGLHAGALADGRMLAKRNEIISCHTLVDIGGGSGGLAIALAQNLPGLNVTILDLPAVTQITRRFVSEATMSDRIQVDTWDVVHEKLVGKYDAAVLRAVIHTLSVDDARSVLLNIGRAINPGGWILIIGAVLDNSRLSPPTMVNNNLVFLNSYDGGQAYTESEYREWLVEAGFRDFTREIQKEGHSLLIARMPS